MVERAALSDYNELLAFENGVFGVDFLKKVPKLYETGAVSAESHGILRESGRIVAAVAAPVLTLQSDCGSLSAVGVGSVAVDAAARGKGYMRELMAFCDSAAAEANADMAFLSGARGRYAHNGFCPCGSRVCFEVTPYFLRHFTGDTAFSFVPLSESAVADAHALFSSQPLHWARSRETFLSVCKSWEGEPVGILRADGTFCGYLIFESGGAFVSELLLHDPRLAAGVLAAFARQRALQKLTVAAEPVQTAMLCALSAFGEHITVQMPAAFKILRLQHFLEVLGSVKARHFAVPAGSLVLQAGAERLRVTVADGRCTAEATDDAPDVTFAEEETAVLLTTSFGKLAQHPLFAAWAPLCPLGIAHADQV